MSELKPCPYSDVLITCPKESVPMVKEFIHAITSNPIEDALRARIAELEAEIYGQGVLVGTMTIIIVVSGNWCKNKYHLKY